MGRELQKRKRRSSRPKVQTHNRSKKLLNPLGNNLIAQNWYVFDAPLQPISSLTPRPINCDGFSLCLKSKAHIYGRLSLANVRPPPICRNKNETMSQNYRRLGLVAKLGKATGGTEAHPHDKKGPRGTDDPLAIKNATSKNGASVVKHVAVERDAEGRIIRVLGGARNPLRDPLNDLDSDSDEEGDGEDDGEEWGGIGDDGGDEAPKVVDLLEREARRPVEKHVRHQSEREREWLQRLVDRHGDDTAAMARDARLNPMQQTKADIARRLKVYRADLKSEQSA